MSDRICCLPLEAARGFIDRKLSSSSQSLVIQIRQSSSSHIIVVFISALGCQIGQAVVLISGSRHQIGSRLHIGSRMSDRAGSRLHLGSRLHHRISDVRSSRQSASSQDLGCQIGQAVVFISGSRHQIGSRLHIGSRMSDRAGSRHQIGSRLHHRISDVRSSRQSASSQDLGCQIR